MSTSPNRTARGRQPGSVASVQETRYLSRPEGRIGYNVAGDGALVVLVPGMGDLRAGYRFLAPGLRAAGYRVACTDLRGHGDSDATFTSYGDQETAGDVIALIEVLGGPAVVVGEQDPDFPGPRAEADWIARALRAQVVMVPGAGHYPHSQRPGITAGAVLRFLESVTGRA